MQEKKYSEGSYQTPRLQCTAAWGWMRSLCVWHPVTSAINHKPPCPCSSNTYHGNQFRGQVKHSYPPPENTTAANKYSRLIHTSTMQLSHPIDWPRIICVSPPPYDQNAYMDRDTNVTEGSFIPPEDIRAAFDLVTLWELEMNYLSPAWTLYTLWSDKSHDFSSYQ